ncbi:type VI secretion system baseplate subunit TssF [Botrimarina mediterranea]|uniref:Type VI secretion system baseplate subunit TssF n=1 Tax=Botrimarina mediterranea TaxID=2528022 RepID=A0A518K8B9_9BACT|nr:type VI secretion system baseplate subunit TssF [Botrimarina mediterranea]QDV74007.1 hypothetical protein Spa11_22060 [Botrimarina mediterranea]
MSTTLYPYYERELHFIRHDAEEFAKQFPAAAGQLLLDGGQSRDPHVERLMEAFALLSARVEKKLDEEFPEVTDGLLGTLYPHYLAPIPSMAIAEFKPDPSAPQPTGTPVPRGSRLRATTPDGVACRYRTCYDTTLWPLDIVESRVELPPFAPSLSPPPKTQGVLRIRLRAHADMALADLTLDKLRFHLQGDAVLVAKLYELLLTSVTSIEVYDAEASDKRRLAVLSDGAIQPVGFEENEGLLPYPATSNHAYRLLTELFAFPQKFAFLDLSSLAPALVEAGRTVDVVVYLSEVDERLAAEVDADTLRLGCTPIVNLFEKVCEPIRLTHTRTEYPIVPDAQQRDATEVYAIDRVVTVDGMKSQELRPLYSLNHENSWPGADEARAFWHTRRRPSDRCDDAGSDVWLRVADRDFDNEKPAEHTVTVHATCTNRNAPERLTGGPHGTPLVGDTPLPIRSVRCLSRPTAPMQPPLGPRDAWRLVSHLSLNHLSLVDERFAAPALQELLRLYDFADRRRDRRRAILNSEMIDGVVSLSSRPTTCRIGGAQTGGFCRGVAVELVVDEESYRGVGAYLFASVLEHFFAEYATVNSFTRLTLATKQSGVVKTWPARAGGVQLV